MDFLCNKYTNLTINISILISNVIISCLSENIPHVELTSHSRSEYSLELCFIETFLFKYNSTFINTSIGIPTRYSKSIDLILMVDENQKLAITNYL